MRKVKVKWVNVLLAILFVISSLYILNTAITLITSLANLTTFGIITTVLALAIVSFTGEYLYDEMQ